MSPKRGSSPLDLKLLPSCLLAVLFLASCAPTYPKERILKDLTELCWKEYKTQVQATIAATTIGILIPVDGLFVGLSAKMSDKDLERISEGLPFSQSALEKIEVVSRALSRVILSTDAPLEFYTVVTRDVPTGLEFVWSGYITDLKRLNYLDISQGDFLRYRTPIALRIQPERVAQRTVEGFLHDVGNRSVAYLLTRAIAPSARLEELLPAMLSLRQEGFSGREAGTPDLITAASLSDREVLVYVRKMKLEGPVAFLFLVEVSEVRGAILQIGRLLDPAQLPEQYHFLGAPEVWEGRFTIEPFSLPQFLADQISRRTRLDLASENGHFHPAEVSVAGSYRGKDFDFKFHTLDLKKSKSSDKLASAIVQTAAEVLHSYRFTDFQNLAITDALKGTRWVVPAKTLPLYRKRNPPALQPLP